MPKIELPSLIIHHITASVAQRQLLLANRHPGPGAVQVPTTSAVELELMDTGVDGVDRNATRVFVNDTLVFEGGHAAEFKTGFNGPDSRVIEGADSLKIKLSPNLPFQSLQELTVRVLSKTRSGAHSLEESYRFTIEDRTHPKLISAEPVQPKRIRVSFDEPMANAENATFQFEAKTRPAVPLHVKHVDIKGVLLELELHTEMSPGALYELTIEGLTDLFSNEVLAPFNRVNFVGFQPQKPHRRNFDLWKMLPKHNRRDDHTGDLRRFIACLQEVTELLLCDVDAWANIFNLEKAPPPFLELILADLGNPFTFDLDTASKRRLGASLVQMYQLKGTESGIRNVLRFFLGVEVEAIVSFSSEALLLGESELGVDWILGPSDRFSLYAFDIRVGRSLMDNERHHIRVLVNYLKPAHTHFIDLIEPTSTAPSDDWELGESELGANSTLR